MRPEIQAAINKIEELRSTLYECDSQHSYGISDIDRYCNEMLCQVLDKMTPDEVCEYAESRGWILDIDHLLQVIRKAIFRAIPVKGTA
jgi:hypothetical protein